MVIMKIPSGNAPLHYKKLICPQVEVAFCEITLTSTTAGYGHIELLEFPALPKNQENLDSQVYPEVFNLRALLANNNASKIARVYCTRIQRDGI